MMMLIEGHVRCLHCGSKSDDYLHLRLCYRCVSILTNQCDESVSILLDAHGDVPIENAAGVATRPPYSLVVHTVNQQLWKVRRWK